MLGLCASPALPGASFAAGRKRHAPAAPATYAHRADVKAWGETLALERDWPVAWVQHQLAQARPQSVVQKLIMPAPVGQPKNWRVYRERFTDAERIRGGLAFWQDNARWLAQAAQRYGVPPEIVVAIVGVETFYGRVTGQFRVIDALATLSFDFPSGRKDRSGFFRDELAAFLDWCRREARDPQTPRGSFAGAIGLPQFMPSSILRHAVDFDGDGHIDLSRSAADVVGSVAHYLAEHGWSRDMATHFEVTPPPPGDDFSALRAPDILPSFNAAQFAERGARLDAAGQQHAGALALVELENVDGPPTYYAGTANFYAVTRYNWSAYYAMAVILLAQALRAARG